MEYYVKSVVPIIESNYDKFTAVEKVVADFFIHNQKKMDFRLKTSQNCYLLRNLHWFGSLKNVDIMAIKNLSINMKKPLLRNQKRLPEIQGWY